MIHAPNRGLLAATLLLCAPAAFAVSSGITDQSGRPGSGNCSSCHSGTAFTYNLPTLTGTTTVAASSSTNYTLSFTKASGNDAIAAGFNLAATSGTLVDPNAAGCPLKKSGTELTHSSPCTPGGSFSWTFSWTAPAAGGDYTFYFCARAVNGNGSTSGDSIGKCSSAVITVTAPANRAPVAGDDDYTTNENTQLTVAAPGVLSNDTDEDGDPLDAVLATDPANGLLSLNADGGFTYMPDSGFNGSDSFTYQASDGVANSDVAMVTINVGAAPPPPAGGGGGGGSPAAVLLGLFGLASLLKRWSCERQVERRSETYLRR